MPNIPKISKLFFQWYCNPELEEQILGDLQEQFEEDIALFGLAKARRRFTWNVIRFCRPGIIKKYKGIQKLNNTGMFKHNVKIAFRNLKRQRSTAFINISGLVLGLSVTLMIALWVKNELSWDKNNENYDSVVRVMQNRVFDEQPMAIKALPVSLASELKENYHDVFDHVVLSSFYWDALISKGDDGVNVKGVRTQPGAPHIMSLEMISGTRESLKQEETILLSASTAYALFGEDSPIGNTVVLNEETMIVRGVYKDLPNTSSFKSVGFLAKIGDSRDVNWESNNYQIFATISSNVTIEEVNNKIKTIINEHLPTDKQNEKNAVFLHPMKDWHLRSSWKNGVQSGGGIVYVHWFSLIGLLVLFLACINFMNLSTAQSIRRAKEVGIRKAIGSVRNQLIIQFMTESIVLVFLSFLIVTGLSYLITPYFNLLTDKQISVPLDTSQYWIYGIMCVISIGILAGSYPAFYLSSFKPLLVLKGTYQTNLSAAIFRKAMVVFQFSISIALIIGTIVISQQIDHTLNRPLGYDGESVISIPMSSSEHYSKANIIENELINSGAITQYAETFNPLTEVWMMNNDFSWVGKDPTFTPMINTLYVSSGFGETVKWKVV
ncbi:MAG: permease prefix domain 2-containing transporter, partial [bacterium]|nr:permease prefix domain 2-containing transporter [bacterium]